MKKILIVFLIIFIISGCSGGTAETLNCIKQEGNTNIVIEIKATDNMAKFVSVSLENEYLLDEKTREYVEAYAKLNESKLDIQGITYTYNIDDKLFNEEFSYDLSKMTNEQISEYLVSESASNFDFLDMQKSKLSLEADGFFCGVTK